MKNGGRSQRPVAVDLFSGAGGLTEGFSQAGFFVAVAVERDPVSVSTHRYNHTRCKSTYRTQVIDRDISDVDFHGVRDFVQAMTRRRVDALIGGPPCQGFSRANMMTRDPSNPTNALHREFMRAVAALTPTVAILENVPDMRLLDGGRFVDQLVLGLREQGYSVEYKVLNAAAFGVPQRRNRIFFIATRDGVSVRHPSPSVEESSYVTVWDAISDLPSLRSGNCDDEMPYASAQGITDYQRRMRARTNGKMRNNLVTNNNELVLRRYRHVPQGGNWRDIPDELMSNYKDKSRCHEWIYRRLREDEPSVAITHFRKSMLIHPREDRGLSVREAARIQSFPDHFTFLGGLGFQQQQVANAVPPLLAKAVALEVRRALGD
ncbi:DNA cytosine methyltransferase [bacterium]|nr:DNA cytosine methyltransferase [bacterium]